VTYSDDKRLPILFQEKFIDRGGERGKTFNHRGGEGARRGALLAESSTEGVHEGGALSRVLVGQSSSALNFQLVLD